MPKMMTRLRNGVASMLSRITFWNVAKFLGILALIGGGLCGLDRMRHRVISLPEFNIDVRSISIAGRPKWAHESLEESFRKILPDKANIFDPGIPASIGEKCAALPWVERVDSVRKSYPNTLEFRIKLRKPVAYIRHASEKYLVDNVGARLPDRYYRRDPGQPDLLTIIGVDCAPPRCGEAWEDSKAVLAGIATVEDIWKRRDLCLNAGITTVDVGNYEGRRFPAESRVVLWTNTQTRIKWGRSRVNRKFGDLSSEQKIANLERALENHRDLKRVDYINIYSDRYSIKHRDM